MLNLLKNFFGLDKKSVLVNGETAKSFSFSKKNNKALACKDLSHLDGKFNMPTHSNSQDNMNFSANGGMALSRNDLSLLDEKFEIPKFIEPEYLKQLNIVEATARFGIFKPYGSHTVRDDKVFHVDQRIYATNPNGIFDEP